MMLYWSWIRSNLKKLIVVRDSVLLFQTLLTMILYCCCWKKGWQSCLLKNFHFFKIISSYSNKTWRVCEDLLCLGVSSPNVEKFVQIVLDACLWYCEYLIVSISDTGMNAANIFQKPFAMILKCISKC